jgi:hypothetical protein
VGLTSASLRKKSPPQGAPVPLTGASTADAGAPAPPVTAALPTGQAAAAALAGLLRNPTVQQALFSQVLGSAGSQQVLTASGTSLPRAAVNNLLTQLIANATEALPDSEGISDERHLQNESGEYLVDPASPDQQAALALAQLQRPASTRSSSDDREFEESWMTEAADERAVFEDAETADFY